MKCSLHWIFAVAREARSLTAETHLCNTVVDEPRGRKLVPYASL